MIDIKKALQTNIVDLVWRRKTKKSELLPLGVSCIIENNLIIIKKSVLLFEIRIFAKIERRKLEQIVKSMGFVEKNFMNISYYYIDFELLKQYKKQGFSVAPYCKIFIKKRRRRTS